MNVGLLGVALCTSLCAGMLILVRIGSRLAARRSGDARSLAAGGAMEGAVFGLLSLIVAFTLSGAASRFDMRRLQIVDEANAIGTAYLRVDVLPRAAQPAMRERLKRYVQLRLEVYRHLPDIAAAERTLARAGALQAEIWREAVAGCEGQTGPCAIVLLPALNQMIDIASTRTASARIHLPWIVFALLFALALLSALFAGYGGPPHRDPLHVLGFAVAISLSVYMIIDLEYPRTGLIRMDPYDQVMVDVLAGMK